MKKANRTRTGLRSVIFYEKKKLYDRFAEQNLFEGLDCGVTAVVLDTKTGYCQIVLTLEQGVLHFRSPYFHYRYPYKNAVCK